MSLPVRWLLSAILVPALATLCFAKQDIERIIFEQQKIEGKIRRPQLVLIKADQRPAFAPMVIQSTGKSGNYVDFVDQKVIDASPYDGAFQFSGTSISNYQQ